MIFVKKQWSPFCSNIFNLEIAASGKFLPPFVHNKTKKDYFQDVSGQPAYGPFGQRLAQGGRTAPTRCDAAPSLLNEGKVSE